LVLAVTVTLLVWIDYTSDGFSDNSLSSSHIKWQHCLLL